MHKSWQIYLGFLTLCIVLTQMQFADDAVILPPAEKLNESLLADQSSADRELDPVFQELKRIFTDTQALPLEPEPVTSANIGGSSASLRAAELVLQAAQLLKNESDGLTAEQAARRSKHIDSMRKLAIDILSD